MSYRTHRLWNDDQGKSHRISVLFLLLLLGAGAVSRFWGLGSESLWLDEALSWQISDRIPRLHLEHGIFFSDWTDAHPPFYYAVLFACRQLFGNSEAALRAPSAVCGTALIGVTYWTGTRWFGHKTGLLAAVLVLANPLLLYYSQEARMYSLAALLVLLSAYSFWRLLVQPGWRWVIPYITASTLMLYTHYLTAFVLLLELMALMVVVLSDRHRGSLTPILVGIVLSVLLFVPWLPNGLFRLRWGQISWMEKPDAASTVDVLATLLGTRPMRMAPVAVVGWALWRSGFGHVVYEVISLVSLPLLIVGIPFALRHRGKSRYVLIVASIPVLLWVISIIRIPLLNGRQAVPYLSSILMVMALGATQKLGMRRWSRVELAWRYVAVALVVVTLALNGFNWYRQYTVHMRMDWRPVNRVLTQLEPLDVVFVYPGYWQAPVGYYYHGNAEIHKLFLKENMKEPVIPLGQRRGALIVKANWVSRLWPEREEPEPPLPARRIGWFYVCPLSARAETEADVFVPEPDRILPKKAE